MQLTQTYGIRGEETKVKCIAASPVKPTLSITTGNNVITTTANPTVIQVRNVFCIPTTRALSLSLFVPLCPSIYQLPCSTLQLTIDISPDLFWFSNSTYRAIPSDLKLLFLFLEISFTLFSVFRYSHSPFIYFYFYILFVRLQICRIECLNVDN